MDIATYLRASDDSYRSLAERAGLRVPSLHMIASGKRGWSPEIGDAIVRASGHRITLEAMTRVRLDYIEKHGARRDSPQAESAA